MRKTTESNRLLSVLLALALTLGLCQSVLLSPARATEESQLALTLQSVTTEGSSNSYVVATFDNTRDELVRVAQTGVKVNGTKLTYNSNQSYISYANVGEFIVSGSTISFYSSSLSEGENTITFCNPNGEDVSVRLSMSKTGDYWSGYTYTVTVLEDETPAEPPQSQDTLFVRLVGSFEHRIVGQQDTSTDAVSSASVGGGYLVGGSDATVHVEYALVAPGTAMENVPEDAWRQPDFPNLTDDFQIDGTKTTVQMAEGSGMSCELNQFNGELTLSGVPTQAGVYPVSVQVTDTLGRSAQTNAVDFVVYSGTETLQAQLSDESLFVRYQDGTRGFDMIPWYIRDFGTENQTVTVPADVKVWYGSHGEAPTPNYGELGVTISLSNGDTPTQTLIVPAGCNLTVVNLRIHSGVKVVVEQGGKLTLRSSIVEGIVEVHGTFCADYDDYNHAWLHGSSVNGQIRLMDGSTLENARIISHTNYSARDDENRRNFAPVVTAQGNVTVKGDAYLLGDEAPSGETGQPALNISGTVTVPEGSTLAAYGGGTSFLTADGGDAIVLENGTIQGGGCLIAVGGYGMNITADTSKGRGGSAVSGTGTISVSKAYLEGGASFQQPGTAMNGEITISNTTWRKLVDGGAEQSNTYWKGTGDASGIVPDVVTVLAMVPETIPSVEHAEVSGITDETYTGSPITQNVIVTLEGNTLTPGTDYDLSYADNTNVGTATVTVTGKGSYTGTMTKTFTIRKASQSLTLQADSSLSVGESIAMQVNGAKTPLSFQSNHTSIAAVSEDGMVTGKAPGTATITVTAAENQNYQAASKTVTIKVKYLATPKLTRVQNVNGGVKLTWNKTNKAVKYRVFYKTGKSGWKKLADTTALTYTWKKAKSGTTYTFTVRCITKNGKLYTSDYNKNGKTIRYVAAPVISSFQSSGSGSMTVKWKKIGGVSGYQIQYSTSKGFPSSSKTVKANASATSASLSKLAGNKTWYVRIRSYKTVSGKTTWSGWSTTKQLKNAK